MSVDSNYSALVGLPVAYIAAVTIVFSVTASIQGASFVRHYFKGNPWFMYGMYCLVILFSQAAAIFLVLPGWSVWGVRATVVASALFLLYSVVLVNIYRKSIRELIEIEESKQYELVIDGKRIPIGRSKAAVPQNDK